jgi:hypothetical protein
MPLVPEEGLGEAAQQKRGRWQLDRQGKDRQAGKEETGGQVGVEHQSASTQQISKKVRRLA